jgi:hypothetical protein
MNGENRSIDDFLEALRESGFSSASMEFARKMISSGPLCDTIPNAHGEFGYEKSNPIPVRNPDGEAEYLRNLRCGECGEAFNFSRVGSFGPGPDGHTVDGFDLVCKTCKHQISLYMDMYHLGPSTRVPKHLKKADG